MNVYNEETLRFLAGKGVRNICLPAELPFSATRVLCAAAAVENVTIEVQVFGRQSLALSARCYHARAHGRSKDTCRFVCENDPDGLVLATLEAKPFLVANGVQTLSWEYLNLAQEIPALKAAGVTRFRLSPHSCDMVQVATAFRGVLDGALSVEGRPRPPRRAAARGAVFERLPSWTAGPWLGRAGARIGSLRGKSAPPGRACFFANRQPIY